MNNNLSSLLTRKGKKMHSERRVYTPIEDLTNYSCHHKNLDFIIRAYLAGQISYLACLQNIIECMAYNNQYRIRENECIFELLQEIIKDASWMTYYDPVKCGDYNVTRYDVWLECISSIYYEGYDKENRKCNDLKKVIEDHEYSPAQALELIQDNWNMLYASQSGYEAIEFCLVCADSYNEPAYVKAAISDIGITLAPIYNKIDEKKKRL